MLFRFHPDRSLGGRGCRLSSALVGRGQGPHRRGELPRAPTGVGDGAAARRYGISRSLLSSWRRAYREGTLGGSDLGGGCVPIVMEEAAPAAMGHSAPPSENARIDIALANGRRLTLPTSLPPSRLAALLAVVDPG